MVPNATTDDSTPAGETSIVVTMLDGEALQPEEHVTLEAHNTFGRDNDTPINNPDNTPIHHDTPINNHDAEGSDWEDTKRWKV